jgi:hypothetical protein
MNKGRTGIKDSSPRTRNKEAKLNLLRTLDSLNRDDVTYKELAEALGQSISHSKRIVDQLGIPVKQVKASLSCNVLIGVVCIATWRQSVDTD